MVRIPFNRNYLGDSAMKFKINESGKIVSKINPSKCSLDKYPDYIDGEVPEDVTHFIDGVFLVQKSEEELRSLAMIQRAGLLLETDWTQLPDVPLATKTAWATYRQQLRDITDQPNYPFEIEWPESPDKE